MNERQDRPDPDALLRRMHEREVRSSRGSLKVFFGFAPGVGKTYRMLQVARDLVMDQKLDVVVGVVEDHGRFETAGMALGLDLLPRRKVEYRGRVLEEFDLDAALARRPKLLLVDELAHTNAPGCRHPKRWQDVQEVIASGIDVFTTVNVQHIESVNDVVTQITGVQVRETVPDAVLDGAAAIELVDIAPDELLQRLQEGKVYVPDQARRATEHFFQRGNLLALRELALRRTAAHVDEDVRAYREEHGVATTWPASERILVCVGPAPSSGRLVRAAARMAAGLRCPWVACYVETTTAKPMNEPDRSRLEVHLRTAETLGATVTRLTGSRVADTLIAYARKHNVTRIVIGKPTHSRFRDRVRGSLLNEVVRGSGDIDVLAISGDGSTESRTRSSRTVSQSASIWSYVLAVALVAATVLCALILRATTKLPDLEMLFLLAVMIAAVRFGRGPSLVAAGCGVACYDYFFVQPLHTFSVDDRKYFLTFAMMFGVGIAVSELAGRLRRQERDAVTREVRTGVLYALTRDLASTDAPERIAKIAACHVAGTFEGNVVIVDFQEDGQPHTLGVASTNAAIDLAIDSKELGVAKWAYEHAELAGLGTDTLPGATSLCAPLRVGPSRLGVLVLIPTEKTALGADQRAFLDVICRQIAVALERARLSEQARVAALRSRTEEMRSSLLSAVSHDLRTPLASITGAATSLRDDTNLDQVTKGDLVDAIIGEAERLEQLVTNLLDMTRLEAGPVVLRKDWVPLDEVIGSALTRLEVRLEHRSISVDIADDVPLVLVDPVLFEQVFVNLFENADKYTPPGSPIAIRARKFDDGVVIDVLDGGPGIPAGMEERVFEKFVRGPHENATGAGLGLAICRGIMGAHGGRITVENRVTGGAGFRLTLPNNGVPPSLSTSPGAP